MFRLIRLLLVFLLLRPFPAPAQAPEAHAVLWQISGKGLQHPSFLFGTIHMICRDRYFWTPHMDSCFQLSGQLCLEMKLDDPAIAYKMMPYLMAPGDKSLKDYFTANEYQILTHYVQDSLGLSMSSLAHFRPVALMSMVLKGSSDCDSVVAYETELMAAAGKAGKPLIGLETVEEQMKILAGISDSAMARNIIAAVADSTGEDEYEPLLQAYLAQDLPRLYALILKSSDLSIDLNGLLYDRNARWIPGIEAVIKAKSTFIAVGAGHLAGPKGVIALLREKGYKVTPVF